MMTTACMTKLTEKLTALGFELITGTAPNSKFTFVRKRQYHVFERIVCEFTGRNNDTAVCWIGVSMTRSIPFKGLTENLLLEEVASDRNRGWTVVKSNEDRCKWFRSVAESAILKLEQIADPLAKLLKANCRESMHRAKACLKEIERHASVNAAILSTKAKASEEQLRVAERIIEWPGVVQIRGTRPIYELATHLVLQELYASRLPNPDEPKEMPLENTTLMWEIQLVADSLLQYGQV